MKKADFITAMGESWSDENEVLVTLADQLEAEHTEYETNLTETKNELELSMARVDELVNTNASLANQIDTQKIQDESKNEEEPTESIEDVLSDYLMDEIKKEG